MSAPGVGLTWLYVVASLGDVACIAGVRYSLFLGLGRGATALLASLLPWLAVAKGLTALGWVHEAWRGVPPRFRRHLTPRQAAGWLVVPVFQFYWAYVVSLALCETLDAELQRAGDSRRSPRGLVAPAVAIYLGSSALYVSTSRGAHGFAPLLLPATLASSALWAAYAIRCDRARSAVAVAVAQGRLS